MKLTILGGGGIRTPMLVSAIINQQAVIGVDELVLMDIDEKRLSLIGKVLDPLVNEAQARISILKTADPEKALLDADFVITTFRVGGMEHRIIDEKVALERDVLGQETTGAGGFAMALRTIPVLHEYIGMMEDLCPDAWLLNFANPSGLLTEYILNHTGWKKAVGICDGPSGMLSAAVKFLHQEQSSIYMDYFGLNHLGWMRRLMVDGKDVLPAAIAMYSAAQRELNLPFTKELIQSLGMVPNEYLHYYYSSKAVVHKLRTSPQTRGEQILSLNNDLFAKIEAEPDARKVLRLYKDCQATRMLTYMQNEATHPKHERFVKGEGNEGYSSVALNVIEGLVSEGSRNLILNVRNDGAIAGFPADAVVEIPVQVGAGTIQPCPVGEIPLHCRGLMDQVKMFERFTINAAVSGSYADALHALTIHPLILDDATAKSLLDEYMLGLKGYFPELS